MSVNTEKESRIHSVVIWAITAVLLILTLVLIFFFISYSRKLGETKDEKVYERYYAMIAEDSDSDFWQEVYRSAKEAGEQQNAYVEMISETLSQSYTTLELMEIAVNSGVDGIIVYAEESEEMTALIEKAYSKNIPVVTLFSDIPNSPRLSFVGVSNYNLGREYGNLILQMASSKSFPGKNISVSILIESNSKNQGQNVLYGAIKDTVEGENQKKAAGHKPIVINPFLVDSTNRFSVEESVRAMFIGQGEELPDIVVGLNEIDTTSIYQSVVDNNAVGLVNILGYYDSEAILRGVERKVIHATVSIDTDQMGQSCIDALSEYYEFGYTSQYFTADIYVINQDNVSKYMESDSDED